MILRGKLKYWYKNLSQCYIFHHKSQCIGLGLKLGLHDDSLSTDCLNHKTGCQNVNYSVSVFSDCYM